MQKEEIEDYIWLTYDRALSLLRFDNDKSILIAAHDFLDQNNIIQRWNPCVLKLPI